MTGRSTPATIVRVAHSFPEWLPQTQTWLYNQVRYTPATAADTHVLCERVTNLDQFAVPNIHCFQDVPSAHRLWDRALRKLGVRRHLGFAAREGRRHGIQLLHSHFGNVGRMELALARRLGARHVTTFYGFDVNKLPLSDPRWRDRYTELFARVDRILCEGSHMARCIVQLGCPPEKVRVQHLGVDVDRIQFAPRAWDGRGALRVLIAASFREKKGIPFAIEALSRLRREVPVELTIIGDAGPEAESQAEKRRILELLDASGLRPHTRLLGYQRHEVMFEEAYGHHVFLSPSVTAGDGDTEGGAPVGIIEMAATGMPIVSTTHCDIPEVILDGVTGRLARERDVDDLARQLTWMAAHPDQWTEMVHAGRAHIEREYHVRTQGERLARTYQELMDA